MHLGDGGLDAALGETDLAICEHVHEILVMRDGDHRPTFIALLGAGPVGYVVRDQQARAQAVTRGYLEQLGGDWRPTRDELRWWLTVAGVQFIHRRWERTGQPGVSPWQETADILAAALNTRDALAPENPA